jgi:hypothetical protein
MDMSSIIDRRDTFLAAAGRAMTRVGVVAATHRHLETMVADGEFREEVRQRARTARADRGSVGPGTADSAVVDAALPRCVSNQPPRATLYPRTGSSRIA